MWLHLKLSRVFVTGPNLFYSRICMTLVPIPYIPLAILAYLPSFDLVGGPESLWLDLTIFQSLGDWTYCNPESVWIYSFSSYFWPESSLCFFPQFFVELVEYLTLIVRHSFNGSQLCAYLSLMIWLMWSDGWHVLNNVLINLTTTTCCVPTCSASRHRMMRTHWVPGEEILGGRCLTFS